MKYICTLAIDGIEYRAISEARNKKDAQVNTSGVRELIFPLIFCSPTHILYRPQPEFDSCLDALCMGFLQSNGHYEKNRRE